MEEAYSPDTLARIQRLRAPMLGEREISAVRAVLMMESYRETEGQPIPIRRARALENILSGLPLHIGPDELLVGRLTDRVRGACVQPELSDGTYDELMDAMYAGFLPVPPELQPELDRCAAYWAEHPLDEGHGIDVTEEFAAMSGSVVGYGPSSGHHSMSYEYILDNGALGLIEKAEAELRRMGDRGITDPVKEHNLRASIIALNALMTIARRYSDHAASLAAAERDERRRAELLEISRVCARVPAHPAATFHEAIQAVWFTNLALLHEGWECGIGFLRFDQYMYPFYKRDIDSGRLDRERAMLLIAMLFVKTNEEVMMESNNSMSLNVTVGGVDRDGNDAVNDVSYLVFEAEEQVRLNNEDIIVRISSRTPQRFLERAALAATRLSGKLKFVCDSTIIKQLTADGKTRAMARDYCITGCNSPTVPGGSYDMPGSLINLPLLLDLALHNGYSPVLGRQMGPETGEPADFRTFEDLWHAYARQCEYFLPRVRQGDDAMRVPEVETRPQPLHSILMDGYIEKGVDVIQGGMWPQMVYAMSLSGAPDVGDAFAAIKKLVYEEEFCTLQEMAAALDADWDGWDELYYRVRKCPKFGNDEPYVDELVSDVLSLGSDILMACPCYQSARPGVAAGVVAFNCEFGEVVGALPDGRRRGEPISEGGLSPHQGRNVSGATATIRSVASVDHMKLRHGSVLNMRFDPRTLQGEDKIKKLAMLLRAFDDLGGYLIQFNIVSTETLKAAKADPASYKDLIVRVATYASYFVELGEKLQDDIINRYEFSSF